MFWCILRLVGVPRCGEAVSCQPARFNVGVEKEQVMQHWAELWQLLQ